MIQESRNALKIAPDVSDPIFRAIAKIGMKQPEAAEEVPEVEEGADETAVAARDEALDRNAEKERENEAL